MARADKVTLTRAELVAVMAEGRAAAVRGDLPTACPYSPNGNADTRVKCAAWQRGYVAASSSD